jgi:hypothetical protein
VVGRHLFDLRFQTLISGIVEKRNLILINVANYYSKVALENFTENAEHLNKVL